MALVTDRLETVGRRTADGIAEVGHAAALLAGSLYWLLAGPFRRQPVRLSAVVQQMTEIGLLALPILSLLALAIGAMLAIQGIYTLSTFGAESYVVQGIALSMTREFGPLITGILVAGRSGSALAARLATMRINQEIDALRVMGIEPVRYLVAPPLIAMLIMVPALTIFAEAVGLVGAGLYVDAELGMGLLPYAQRLQDFLTIDDLLHGIGKSVLFALLIALIAVVNGAGVIGGAEGVGRVTTRSVVQAISAIVITDMLFALVLMR